MIFHQCKAILCVVAKLVEKNMTLNQLSPSNLTKKTKIKNIQEHNYLVSKSQLICQKKSNYRDRVYTNRLLLYMWNSDKHKNEFDYFI